VNLLKNWDGKSKVSSQVAEIFELPKDVVMNLPKLTLIGNILVYIENHRGIIQYDDQLVRINLLRGELNISGQNLMIRSVVPEEIVVEGRIDQIGFIKED
jgi:sporulation protein YqfC